MASVKTLHHPDGRVRGYRLRWRDSAGQPRSKTLLGAGAKEAQAEAVRVEDAKRAGTELDRRAGRLSVAAWAAEWTAVQSHRPATAARVASSLAPLLELVGAKPILSVRQSHIMAWKKARLDRGISPLTLRSEWTWVAALLAAAVAERLIPANPCDGVSLPTVKRRPVTMPDPDQADAIIAQLPASWAFMGRLATHTGLRPSELMGLHLEQVDFLRRTITVDRQLSGGRIVAQTKTEHSRREVPVLEETVLALSAHLAAFPAAPSGLVFHRADGSPLVHRDMNTAWARAARRAGAPGVRLHDMRHFYASAMLRASRGDYELVAKLLGHARSSITHNVYGHVFSDADSRAREALAQIFGRVTVRATNPPETAKYGL